jgi:hypothetical protein
MANAQLKEMEMNRHLIALCAVLAAVSVLTPSAGASRPSRWSEPAGISPMINTGYDEGGPAISRDGLTLYFQSNRPGGVGTNNCDIWIARRQSVHQEWDWPENLGLAVNSERCESAPALSRDEHYLFFARLNPTHLWVSYRRNVRDDSGWEPAVLLSPGVNSEASDGTPKHFESKKYGLSQLYFYSTRPGGLGSFDIYVANAFGGAVPVQELNSPQIDASPTVSRNGLEIFFHSNRLGTIGERDLWTSVRTSVFDPWSNPVNLGDVVNSASNEQTTALSSDGETLFFGSDRPGGFGLSDIYMTTRSKHGRD